MRRTGRSPWECAAGLLCLLLFGGLRPALAAVPIVFGDSYSDVGRTLVLSEGYWPKPPYWNGRVSNGPLWTEVAANGSGWEPAANYAVASSTVDKRLIDAEPKFGETGVAQQVEAFRKSELAARLRSGGATPVFFIWIGINDILQGLVVRADPLSFPSATVPSVERSVARLVELVASLRADFPGARFVLPNVPPVDRSPIVQRDSGGPASAWSYANARGQAEIGRLVAQWNGNLTVALFPGTSLFLGSVDGTPRDWSNGTHAVLDANARFAAALRALRLGEAALRNASWPCYVGGRGCEDPDRCFWWDYVHPSAVVHKWMGGWVGTFLDSWVRTAGTAASGSSAAGSVAPTPTELNAPVSVTSAGAAATSVMAPVPTNAVSATTPGGLPSGASSLRAIYLLSGSAFVALQFCVVALL
ncbi:hypothetical protein DFJ74DRAFT_648636, partial [Hyaloraphidium curvatum]